MKLNQDKIDLELSPRETVVAIVSAQIQHHLRVASSEQYFPYADADQMDRTIEGNLKRAAALRKLRDEYENLVSEVVITSNY